MDTAPITLDVPGAGHAVITRVPGTDHADIRLSLTLPADDHAARLRMAALVTHLRALIGPARATGRAA